MSLPRIVIVDAQHNDERIDLEDLTETALVSLCYECEHLLEKIKENMETGQQ